MNRSMLISLLLVTQVLGQGAEGPDEEAPPPLSEGLSQLVEALRADPQERKGAMRELVARGESIIPDLFAGLGPASPLHESERRQLEALLARFGAASVYGFLGAALGEEPDLEIRMRTLRIVGVVGGRGSWSVLKRALTGLHPHALRSATVTGNIQVAITRAISSDRSAPGSIAADWPKLPTAWHPAILKALSQAGTRDAIRLLVRLVDRAEAGRVGVLAALTRAPLLALDQLDPHSWSSLCVGLRDPDSEVRYRTAQLVARGHWVDSFVDLMALLEDEDQRVRRVALAAAQRMSGVRIGVVPSRWSDWYEQESAWRDGRLEQEVALLGSDDPRVVCGARRTLAGHRLFRDVVLPDVLEVLTHEDDRVRAAACGALAALGAPHAGHDLVELLEDREVDVRNAALTALRAVTGMTYGADRDTWKAALRRT